MTFSTFNFTFRLQDDENENEEENVELPGTIDHLMTVDDENENALLLKQRPHGKVSRCVLSFLHLL